MVYFKKMKMDIDLDDTLAASIAVQMDIASGGSSKSKTKEELNKFKQDYFMMYKEEDIIRLYKETWKNYRDIKLEHPSIPLILNELSGPYQINVLTITLGTDPQILGWLRLNGIPYTELIHLRGDNYAEALQNKIRYGIESGADIFVDDSYELIRAVAEHGKRGILLRQPWNEAGDTNHSNITVAKDWTDVARLLRV